MRPGGELVEAAAEAGERLVWEAERAAVLGTVPPTIDDLKELVGEIQGIAVMESDDPECACFEGLRWPKMSQAERRDILVRLRTWAATTDDGPRALAIDAVVEALQRVSETEGVL